MDELRKLDTSPLTAARDYLGRGWRPIPVATRGKEPLVKWTEFQRRAPTAEEVTRWFTVWREANVAIVTGSGSGLAVLDVDGPEGEASLRRLDIDLQTLTRLTGRGRHLVYAHPGRRVTSRTGVGPGLDVRGDGAYIVAPPSIHHSGARYRWSTDAGYGDVDTLKPFPPAILKLLSSEEQAARVPEGRRKDTIAREAGRLLRRGASEADALFACLELNATRCDPPLSAAEVVATVASIAGLDRTSHPPSRARIIRLSEVKAEPVEWLWQGYIPSGKLVLLDGDPGVGKSTLSLDLAARISTGRPMPDGSSAPVGGVVVINAEDGLADTVIPRLMAMGADVSRILSLSNDTGGFCIPDDLALLAEAIDSAKAVLVVIDPLMACLPRKISTWNDQHVRTALAPLAALADERHVAVMMNRHLNKKADQQPMYRGGGSIAIIGAARAGFVVGRDPGEPQRLIFAPVKFNLGPKPPALSFRLTSDGAGLRVEWEGPCDVSAEDLLAVRRASPVEVAKSLIQSATREGPVTSRDLEQMAREAGLSPRTVARARKALGVNAQRHGFGAGSTWTIEVPSERGQGEEE